MAVAVAFVVAMIVAGCSGSSSGSSTSSVATMSAAEAEAWFARAMDLVSTCQSASKALDDAVQSAAADPSNPAAEPDVALVAGRAIAMCRHLDDEGDVGAGWAPIEAAFPTAAQLLREWSRSTLAVDVAVLVAAAGNLHDRSLVDDAYDAARSANLAADAFEAEVARLADVLGVAEPEGEVLFRWNAPAH